MQLHAAIDPHASNHFIGVVDEKGKRAFKRKLPNHPGEILLTLGRFHEEMVDVVVETTFNWYWLVDLLGDAGYQVSTWPIPAPSRSTPG